MSKTQRNPTLPGVSKEASDQINVMNQTIQRCLARIQALENAGYLTRTQADRLYGPEATAAALSSNGTNPLNVVAFGGTALIQPRPVRSK